MDDFERMQRLKKRNIGGVDQNMLNCSSWLRMHHQDPQWMQHVLKENCWHDLDCNTWDRLSNWDSKASVKILDTTGLTINRVAERVADWVNAKRTKNTGI